MKKGLDDAYSIGTSLWEILITNIRKDKWVDQEMQQLQTKEQPTAP